MFKKIILIVASALSLALFALIGAQHLAIAETPAWARILEDGVYLYSTEGDAQRCFALEKSYYVEIIGETERMYFVSVMQNQPDFPKITGYVFKSQVKACESVPFAPYYPTIKITVDGGSAAIRLSPLTSAQTVLVATNTQQLSYYGSIDNYGIHWYYVQYGGFFGYVNSADVTAVEVPLHPTPLPQQPVVAPPSEQEPVPQTPESSAPASEILLIVFVVVLAVGLTLALFLPGNIKKKKAAIFDRDI